MTWIILNLIGMGVICVINVVNMKGGFDIVGIHIPAYYFFIACSIGLTGWIIPKSFVLAGPNNFFLIVMIGNVALSIGGLIGTYFVFNAPITMIQLLGGVVTLIGIGLLTITKGSM